MLTGILINKEVPYTMAANNLFDDGKEGTQQIVINIHNLTINNGNVGTSQVFEQNAKSLPDKEKKSGKSKLLKVLAEIVGFFKLVATKICSLIRFLLHLN